MRKVATLTSPLLLLVALQLPTVWGADNSVKPTSAAASESEIRIIAPAVTAPDELAEVLSRGQKLESEQRWGEAVSLYEDTLRQHGGDQAVVLRHDIAKLHYDISRRYNDKSFLSTLSSVSERDAYALYNEVLLKLQSHYVHQPDYQLLVARGTRGLKLALKEKPFAQRNLAGKTATALDDFARGLDRLIGSRTIITRQQAVDAVALAAYQGRQQLGLSPTAVVLEYVSGATGGLDEYSAYLTSDQLSDVYSQIEGNFVGLGIELKAQDNSLLIVKVITGSPAEAAGLRSGDRITAVDGRTTVELNTDQAADMLQGPEGTKVRLVLAAPSGQSRQVSVERRHVDVPSVDEVQILDRDYGVGYLKLTCFQKTTSRDLDAALWRLHREGMKSLIIDLRGNPGGLLTSSVEVADKFVDTGSIVSTRGRSSLEDYTYTAHKAGTWRVPLVVLIDGESASASEIFAGAIRDHHRGSIVGQRSYGKGSVQGIFPLTVAGCGLRLTTAKFYSPGNRPISNIGVQPDIVVQKVAKPAPGETDVASAETDPVISAGIHAARQQMAKR